MEGMEENNLEFYFYRFEIAFTAIQHWFFIIFIVLLIIFLLIYIFDKKRKLFKSIVIQFPSLKFQYPQFFDMQLSEAETSYREAAIALMRKTRF